MSAEAPLPLLVVAGSPGAGKTSLLARWMADPDAVATAVLVNEPTGIAIDAHLVGGHAGAARAFTGGCACCDMREELPAALESLAGARRGAARFERVWMELSGFAHPAPVLASLEDARIRERFPLHGFATIVDALAGLRELEDAGARARVAAADVLVIAKTDLVPAGEVDRLVAALARVNPDAEILRPHAGAADSREVWDAARSAPGRELRRLEAAVDAGYAHERIGAFALRLPAPVELSGFCLRLAGFLYEHRERVLRVKGLVAVQGRRGPAVIQAVGAALHPVRTLRDWPAGAAHGALVVIARGLDEATIRAALT
ncbi:MAG TPA: GTP-binding protein [Usitatibacter sp.]|nr:GTP-binding protein [Usitatibacter sp.]